MLDHVFDSIDSAYAGLRFSAAPRRTAPRQSPPYTRPGMYYTVPCILILVVVGGGWASPGRVERWPVVAPGLTLDNFLPIPDADSFLPFGIKASRVQSHGRSFASQSRNKIHGLAAWAMGKSGRKDPEAPRSRDGRTALRAPRRRPDGAAGPCPAVPGTK